MAQRNSVLVTWRKALMIAFLIILAYAKYKEAHADTALAPATPTKYITH